MAETLSADRSNGYEQLAGEFISTRTTSAIGAETVRDWARTLSGGAAILDLGCGHGVPISQALIQDGFAVHGVDASPRMIAAFRDRFPDVPIECEAVEDSNFFGRTFDGVVAWGLMFLLSSDAQSTLIHRVARALDRGGQFLFTSPQAACAWPDALTGRQSLSLGAEVYKRILVAEGLVWVGEHWDEGDNHYYCVSKPGGPRAAPSEPRR